MSKEQKNETQNGEPENAGLSRVKGGIACISKRGADKAYKPDTCCKMLRPFTSSSGSNTQIPCGVLSCRELVVFVFWGCGFRFSYIVSCFPRCMTMKRCTTTLSGSCHLPLPRLQTSDCNILYTATVSPSCRVQGLRVTASRVEGVAFGYLCYLKWSLS